jgi:glycosyltransferase involved in cell wall biosynthesis
VVPLYNHAAYIDDAIDSILAQGDLLREVIVIDDGSTDGSAKIMRKRAASDPRIRFETQANRGAHATLNTALESCGGEFLAVLNSDDAWQESRLAVLVAALDADASAGLAWSSVGFMDGASASIENAWYEAGLQFYRDKGDLGAALINANIMMTTSNLLLRRSTWQKVGPFAALRYTHDLDWILRALALGVGIALVDVPLLRYRIHATNTIAEDHTRVRAELAASVAAYLHLLWDRADAPSIDWNHAAAVQSVLRIHELDRAVAPCMAYLRRENALGLDGAGLLDDAAFRSRLAGWV